MTLIMRNDHGTSCDPVSRALLLALTIMVYRLRGLRSLRRRAAGLRFRNAEVFNPGYGVSLNTVPSPYTPPCAPPYAVVPYRWPFLSKTNDPPGENASPVATPKL